ncbi:MAG: hypothetical protein JWM41_706 [Gemmatimonadetes bacterium]|nr:hypothetical protein [Gemmatimonadota bacterium]
MRRKVARPRFKARLEARRGSILVLTAVMLTALMVVGALAIDVSRMYVVRNEAQTAADAAALAAAAQLSKDPLQSAAVASTLAAANNTIDGPVTVSSVTFGSWDDSKRLFTANADPKKSNAVKVIVGRQASFTFGGAVTKAYPTVGATSIAYSPPVLAPCANPWAIPYYSLMRSLGKGDNAPITAAEITAARDTVGTHRKGIAIQLQPTNAPSSTWTLLSTMHQGNTGGGTSPSSCNHLLIGPTNWIEFAMMMIVALIEGQQICRTVAANVCYNANGRVGVPMAFPVWQPPADVSSTTTVSVSYIALVMVTGVSFGSSWDQWSLTGFIYDIFPTGTGPPGAPTAAPGGPAMLVR